MRHIFIEEPYGPEAICFYEFVFGAKVMCSSNEMIQTNDNNKGTTRFESTQLKFGPNCITVSERNPDSSLVNSETPTIMWLDMKDIDPVVTRAKKIEVVVEDQVLTTSPFCRLAKLKDPYGIIWMLRSSLVQDSDKKGDEIEEAEKVTIWEKQQHMYVKEPNGHKAIHFCKSVFRAEEVASNEQTKIVDEKASTSMVTSELKIGRKSIIVSAIQLDHDSSVIDKNVGSGVGTQDYIYVEVEHIPATMVVAVGLGAYCDIVKTDVGCLTKIMDPFGNTWLARTAKPPAPVKRDSFV